MTPGTIAEVNGQLDAADVRLERSGQQLLALLALVEGGRR